MSQLRRAAGLLLALAMVLGAFRTAALAAAVASEWREATAASVPPAPLILVLGDRPENGEIGRHFQQRLDRALALFQAGQAGRILVSGGGNPPEAEAGYRYLVERGVPSAAIRMETRSCSTAENIANSLPLLSAAERAGPILLVTNGSHLKRAMTIARAQGLPVEGIPAEAEAPSLRAAWPNLLYEAAALWVYPYWVSPPGCN